MCAIESPEHGLVKPFDVIVVDAQHSQDVRSTDSRSLGPKLYRMCAKEPEHGNEYIVLQENPLGNSFGLTRSEK